jgi:hypothetical protein
MNLKYSLLIATGLLAGTAIAYTSSSGNSDRRAFLTQSVGGAVAGMTFLPFRAHAEDVDSGFITTESGLKYKVVKEGTGAIPSPGQTVKAHYTGVCHKKSRSLGACTCFSRVLHFVFVFSNCSGWMTLIRPKSLIRVAIVVVRSRLRLAKAK